MDIEDQIRRQLECPECGEQMDDYELMCAYCGYCSHCNRPG